MNNNKAKALRAAAREITVGGIDVAYNEGRAPVYRTNPFTQLGTIKVQSGVPRTLQKGCTRKVYKELKKLNK